VSGNKFNVGDRVAFYTSAGRSTGVISEVRLVIVAIKTHEGGIPIWQHVKQCRRLKKKEPRRVWCVLGESGMVIAATCDAPHEHADEPRKWLEFREVRK
jgi:hypothetical protein